MPHTKFSFLFFGFLQLPPVESAPIAPNEYVATFRVTTAPATPTPAANVTTGAFDLPLTDQDITETAAQESTRAAMGQVWLELFPSRPNQTIIDAS